MNNYWSMFTSFTEDTLDCFGQMVSFLISNPLTFTAIALGILYLAFDIYKSLQEGDNK